MDKENHDPTTGEKRPASPGGALKFPARKRVYVPENNFQSTVPLDIL